VAVEEYYLSPDISTIATAPHDPALHLIPSASLIKLRNIGPTRIREMRANGVSTQILSHVPIDVPSKSCQKINDMLASSIVTSPDRFAAIALLPTSDPKEAANELQRCVTKFKFVGGLLGIKRDGHRLDGVEWDVLWAVAERYKVPIALRPLFPSLAQLPDFAGSAPQSVIFPLITAFHAHHTVSPYQFLHLYASKLFDRFPHIRFLISQFGHSVPPLISRIEPIVNSWPESARPKRKFLEVWQQNIYISTADVLDLASMRALTEQIPVDRILYASNYPFEENSKVLMGELKESGIVGKEEWEGIAWKNAEKLFGLKGAG
ncbi:hypothetical protein BDV96DRAFT_469700, partial [Lophiotrema nucula]